MITAITFSAMGLVLLVLLLNVISLIRYRQNKFKAFKNTLKDWHSSHNVNILDMSDLPWPISSLEVLQMKSIDAYEERIFRKPLKNDDSLIIFNQLYPTLAVKPSERWSVEGILEHGLPIKDFVDNNDGSIVILFHGFSQSAHLYKNMVTEIRKQMPRTNIISLTLPYHGAKQKAFSSLRLPDVKDFIKQYVDGSIRYPENWKYNPDHYDKICVVTTSMSGACIIDAMINNDDPYSILNDEYRCKVFTFAPALKTIDSSWLDIAVLKLAKKLNLHDLLLQNYYALKGKMLPITSDLKGEAKILDLQQKWVDRVSSPQLGNLQATTALQLYCQKVYNNINKMEPLSNKIPNLFIGSALVDDYVDANETFRLAPKLIPEQNIMRFGIGGHGCVTEMLASSNGPHKPGDLVAPTADNPSMMQLSVNWIKSNLFSSII